MLLNPKAVKAAAGCVSDDACLLVLNGINVKGNVLQATDGHVALTITDTAPIAAEDFPAVSDFSHDVPPAIILPKPLMDAAKALPKRSILPVLQRIALGRNGNSNALELVTTDLDVMNRAAVRPIEGPYPDLDKVTPKTDPVFVTGLTVDVVLKLFKALKAGGVEVVRLELHKPTSAMTLHGTSSEGLQADAILMPAKVEGARMVHATVVAGTPAADEVKVERDHHGRPYPLRDAETQDSGKASE